MGVQPPVVAGTFYPASADDLARAVDQLLTDAPDIGCPPPKAVIMPHAGYRFSGATAAVAAKALSPDPTRVVVIGPSHRFAFDGVALPDADAMVTPLGALALAKDAVEELRHLSDVVVEPRAFANEHSIEVELPFLQRRLQDCQIVPLVVGDIDEDRLAEILETLWGGDETVFVISTDLSHFLASQDAAAMDARTARAIELTAPEIIGPEQACGHRPLSAFLRCAGRRGMRLTRADLTHSGRITGDNARVVGYGAWLAHAADRACLSVEHRGVALRVARQALISRARRGKNPEINLDSFPKPLQGHGAAFVSLQMEGRLRGCIGSLQAHRPLALDVMDNAIRAGFNDPRFRPVTASELETCSLEISILSRPAPMTFGSERDLLQQLVPGRDGLIFEANGKRGTFLPKVWDSLVTPEAFLNGLKVKAGLPRDHWSGDVRVSRYRSEDFAESTGATT